MSIDGRFSLSSAFERFLTRCPKLGCILKLKSLSQKGDKLIEEEIVNSIAELFLHPNYTIPMIGCFRPIARKIVNKSVELLRLVPSLKSNSEDAEMETGDEDDNYVIEFYVRSGKGLKLHELACLAFSRALDLAPFLLNSVLSYFSFAPPPFQRLLATSASQLIEKDGTHLLDAVRASFRLLLVEPQVFSELWDWSSFLDLVHQSANVNSGNDTENFNNALDIRWCVTRILYIVLKMSDRANVNFGLDAEKSLTSLLRWEEFCQDVSMEKAGWYLETTEPGMGVCVDENMDFNQEYCLQFVGLRSSSISSLYSHEFKTLRKDKKLITWDVKSVDGPFVLTSAVKKSFDMVLLAVSQKWPVLLYGPTGAGKTALINKLAQISGQRVLSIHMDEQMDGKTLIGSYVCTEQPGEFRWQPGSLTQAVLNGLWVVFEDIDKAPSDVHSILLPLLEGVSSFVTGRGEAIGVAASFRLFSTISSSKNDISHNSEGRISLGVLWRRVMIGPSSSKDFLDILNAWYPNLEGVAEKLIETFEKVNSAPPNQLEGSQSFSRFSLRDLLKWCKRITGLGFSFLGLSLSAYECKSIYQEAVDIFAASSSSCENRLSIMKEISKIWGVTATEAETLFPPNKPIIQDLHSDLRVGRITLERPRAALHHQTRPFANIRSSLHVLERIACSVKYNEPALLVGETGTGKTTLVQNLAMRLGRPLTVLNLSQQSDVADLLGGLKPTDPQFICIPLYNEFMELFSKTFSVKDNMVQGRFLDSLRDLRTVKNWKKILKVFQKSLQKVIDYFPSEVERPECGTKRKRSLGEEVQQAWESFSVKLHTARRQIDSSAGMAFSFVEGAFVTALRNGHWILLDEVNLAPPETLQRVMGVLEGEKGSLCLAERGDVHYIDRHPDFRLFACMNPATDVGKRDLSYSLRSRFTEYVVDEVLDDEDLTLFVNQFIDDSRTGNKELVKKIVHFYKTAKKESEERLQDGANQKPQFSLRSLYRALEYMKKAERKFGFQKALYDGFCMFFLTMLDKPSAKIIDNMILKILGEKMPRNIPFDDYLVDLKLSERCKSDTSIDNYILTTSVKDHLRNLARALLIKRYPVLLQGPTSSGKTSLVHYLASITGHEFVRINNHEHTDLQEYLGSYVTDPNGKLVFQEGVLVKAVRNGSWIVLDELNLAPSDVLEALNRLLDDNRELFVPELQETVQAHPNFMLFATQNPPTFYGGRKMLSRAFRNRFVEIHVDEIPEDEISTILEKRCKIPESYARKMVDVMKDLQLHRQSSKVFAGKHGFITPRDLFRWADRFRTLGKSYEDLAKDGYFLLAERLRDESEKNVVQEILERRLRVKLVKDNLYMQESTKSGTVLKSCDYTGVSEHLGSIMWTRSMWRLYFLVERCYKLREPVLLVGETGGGKTTVCQLLSIVLRLKLHILNCHQYTETSDFLGGFYPVRDRSRLSTEFRDLVEQLMSSNVFLLFPGSITLSYDIGEASSMLDQLNVILNSYRHGKVSHPDVTKGDLDAFEKMKLDLVQLHQKWHTIFTWLDGPLLQAMKDGDLFLVDEISLADDSVLERLNSVLEPERKLSLAEKGGAVLEKITAHPSFFLLATMNPGGDYGKKELSPALRNRFTEIWVTPVSDLNELQSIAVPRFVKPTLSYIVDPMLKFWEWFNQLQTGRMLTVRDLLSWVDFINVTDGSLGSYYAFLHGVFLILLDGLTLGTGISRHDAEGLRERCLSFILECLKMGTNNLGDPQISKLETYGWGNLGNTVDIMSKSIVHSDHLFGINPFYIRKGDKECRPEGFEFLAPTTCRNAMRVLRAMQLSKPVLLEGSPGVGKTSLIVALGKFSGHKVVRINLSEQTDIMDLLGSDLPVEDAEGMKFAWSDGILLQALKNGNWVLLDELNLAPQSVLEGLNAILDHRAEVFIPELGITFKCPSSFRVFACQNPSCQGGGRKGLPKSFLNRFTKVYVDELFENDYHSICSSLYPSIPRPLLSKLIRFNKRLYEDTMLFHKFGRDGSPWEFNLRDVIRSCQIIEGAPEKSKVDCFLSAVYIQRMRTEADRREVLKLYEEVFGVTPFINPHPQVQMNPQYLIIGNTFIERNTFQPHTISKSQLNILPGSRQSLEAVVQCVQNQWLCILVGPSSSGKTSLVRLLAQLTGNVLNELNLSSATDISELLGCFEQYNAFRNFRSAIALVEMYIGEYFSLSLESTMEEVVLDRKGLVSKWSAFLSTLKCSPTSSSTSAYAESWKSGSYSSMDSLVQIIEQLKLGLVKYQLPTSWSAMDLDKILKTILDLQENNRKQIIPAKFEWVTGLLIKAIECGEWVVLENANLCNPTVLDRINSLVEPSGSITINECGLVDGKPMVVHPHHKFRLFLTVNPRYGEVSRAMRNRGVEVFMMQPHWLYGVEDGHARKETEIRDVKRFLVLSGIPIEKLVDIMAESHIFARETGVSLGIQITLLELTRWVQLLQQLLMNGNKLVCSLQLSWEHTYLSSLGEAEGRDTVEHAKNTFLSASNLSKLDTLLGYSLSLPGGWPMPLKLTNFMLWSKEACIKQNCMYLEFLGAQCASYELSVDHSGHVDDRHLHPSLIPLHKLHRILFPTTSNQGNFRSDNLSKFDLALANKMLFFAANWTMERAIEGDVKLYLLWFSWFSSRLQPYCRFFNSYLAIIEQEMDHVIWKYIVDCRRELISHFQINVNMHLLPMLSLKLMEWTSSNETFKMLNMRLYNAIQCVGLLRLSFQQWNAEDDHNYNEEAHLFIPLLESLRELEREVLNKLVDSPCFDVLFQLYGNLLEDHTSFWNGIISTQLEFSVLSWRSLKKNAIKLRGLFPKAVKTLLLESRNLGKELPWNFHSPKSMLWVHGGHPFLPSSADIYSRMLQLLRLCKLIWPVKMEAWKQASSENDCFVKSVISANRELRSLAMQGVCMSSYFIRKDGQDDAKIVQQLEEMYQMLLGRFDHEKHKLEAVLVSDVHASLEENSAACCVFCPKKLCYKPSFDSWKETLPLFDSTSFFLDMEILKELSKIILVDTNELFSCLSNASELVEFSMDFSLKFSSRSPLDFVPHQTLLWTLDAWNSVDSVHTNVASSILDMWLRWHSFLWTYCPESVKIDGCDMPLPYMLFQPTKTATLDHILQGAFPIKDYTVHCLKLRAASGNVWQDSPPGRDLPCILLSAAQSLFQQIIVAHRKSFDEEKYSEIKSIFCSIQGNQIKQEKLQDLNSLIASSSHSRLISLMDLFIEPLLKELYLQHSSHDFLYNLAHAWLHIGGLRFHLLLALDDLDPAMKYSFKHSQLVTKISLLELEIKVRQECDHLAGTISMKDDLNQRAHLIEKLEMERRRLERKIVFRHGPAKFTKLKSECAEFLRLVTSSILTKNVEVMNVSQMIEQDFNWQETATGFINRLTDDYAAYVDICQPVQVAMYEMKLGLSLLVSSALQKAFLRKIDENTTDHILETIYCFMRFPRDASADNLQLDLLKKLCISPRDSTPDKMVSVLQRHAAVYVNILVRITYNVCNSLVMETTSFKLLNEIFDQFAGLWMSMKVQTKAKHEEESQNYKFKPRAFKIEDIFEVDISTLRNTTTDESLCLEWQEMLAEDETTELAPVKEHENPEEEWNLIQESILKTMVHVHNQFFGESNIVERPGIVQISDADKLFCFLDSYKLGMGMLKDLPALLSSSLDAKLMPEHLLRLCLDYEEKFGLSLRPALVYNIYKDSNAPVMAKMVKPLTSLQQRVLSLLNDWPEHPGLQKILDVTKMLLAIPLSTPLAKALSGLQFLLSKARMLEESAPKFSLSDHLQPIFILVSSWQKMELDSWPALLDGVQEQYEINCGKLWLPLYSVLHREHTDDIAGHNRSTIRSLEEFVQTSSIGEFKKRLQLLLAFHGQINIGIHLKFYSSPSMMENLKILYNAFGYYEQFLAIVTEHIEANKITIAADLKELVKLSRWDRPDSYLSIETSKRTRQKLQKLIQKFNDILQQPVMVIVKQDITKRGIKVQSLLGTKTSSNTSNTVMMLPVSIDPTLFSDTQRSMWYGDFRKKVDSALQNLCPRMISGFDLQYLRFKDAEEIANTIRQSLTSQSACLGYQEEWKEVWLSLENICRTAIDCADLWKDESKSFGKRRALTDLLKLLESCGLSRHKSLVSEDEPKSNQHSSWFLQPSYDVQYLLLPRSGQPSPNDNSDSNWKIANQYYYKSMAMVQLLREICLNFHKDFSLEQIVRSASFLNHLIIIQQEQRSVAYGFAEHLKSLRKCAMSLKDLDTNSSIVNHGTNRESCVSPNQHAMHECMWQQKQLYDTLYAFSHEASLLLRKVENTHLNTCQSVKVAANKVLVFIEKFIPNLQISKESLDKYLLASNRILTTPAASLPPFVVSKKMEQLVTQNFQEINDFEKHLHAFFLQFVDKRSVREPLLGRYGDILNKGKVIREEFHSVLDQRNQSIGASEDFTFSETFTNLETAFAKSFNQTLKQIREAFQKLGSSSNGFTLSDDSMRGNITKWKVLVESSLVNMRLDLICEALGETIVSAVELVDHAGHRFSNLCSQMQIYLNHLCVLVDLILTFGDGLLLEFLAMHRTVAEMTHMLAYVFASLYSKGFGGSSEDHADDTCADMTQDASGTGMGEGAGLNDVSDQINDEDQLLGASEKPSEGQDAPNDVPNKNDKGIEMDQDFAAETFSVSEDSGDDENEDNDEDEKLESAMGETGDDGEVVDEKLWNKEEDENHNTTNEKYESGPSVKDEDSGSRELRAKEDGTNIDESGELSGDDESDKHEQHNDENQNISDDSENLDDMKMDKDASYADPTGIQLDEKDQDFEEEINLGEPEGSDTMEEAEQQEDDVENGNNEDGKTNEEDEDMEEVGGSEHAGGNVDGDDDQGKDHDDESAEKDLTAPSKSLLETGKYDFTGDSVPSSAGSAVRPNVDAHRSDSNSVAPETQWSNNSNIQNGLAPSSGLPNDVPQTDIMMPDSIKDGKLTADQPESQSTEHEHDSSSMQRAQPNPYRSVGDALEKWKERVKVSVDSQENKTEAPDDMEDDSADEYGFVSEFEKGTSQAQGPATSDQIDKNVRGSSKPDGDEGLIEQKEDFTEMEVEKQDSETLPVRSYNASMVREKINEQVQKSDDDDEVLPEGLQKVVGDNDDSRSLSGNLISIRKSYMNEEILQLSNLTVDDDEEMGMATNLEEVSGEMKDNATSLWRRYELSTTRLSQELAEQLRLVMEPTLASKLQGDYKTGKRINMKKVIPYIASHYRKDKIWLRRTRPNKRDYQVIVAVDDSRSMSESHCGDVAIEALVTVCRAMSQLEVGQLAVASFGKKGNIQLLHDFNQSFTGEAGIKMISSLTFKQENTIEDEPMVDLLTYLNNKLDAAVANARLPSGQNPLQQLMLIIADGRFHEKEKLKRCVRDALNKRRMVAFLLVDSPEESIMDFMEASYEGKKLVLSKYLNSFPFPYYIILKNIEALPRTLADLLRQWFELMQNTRD